MIKLYIFDLDGTIADTSEGILNSHRYAHVSMGRLVPPDHVLFSVIGGPLLDTYRKVFHFPEDEALQAVRNYRAWYAEFGVHQAKLYPGIPELLERICERGCISGMATLKAEPFAKDMMEALGVKPLFQMIYGMDGSDRLTKADLIQKCMYAAGIGAEETCMIGDSVHDYNGARQVGVDFIGVTYGFGFRRGAEEPFPLCDSPSEIAHSIER